MRLEDFADEICDWCGTGFTSGRLNQRFCCPECRDEAKRARARHPVVVKTCPHCRTAFETTRLDQQKYCSERCRHIHGHAFAAAVVSEERRRMRAGRNCRYCGKPFEAKRSDQVYCCRRCTGAATIERNRGCRPAEARASLKCVECGGPIPNAKRTDQKYCPTCRHAVRNERSRIAKRKARAMSRSMSHGVAVPSRKPLKTKGINLQHDAT